MCSGVAKEQTQETDAPWCPSHGSTARCLGPPEVPVVCQKNNNPTQPNPTLHLVMASLGARQHRGGVFTSSYQERDLKRLNDISWPLRCTAALRHIWHGLALLLVDYKWHSSKNGDGDQKRRAHVFVFSIHRPPHWKSALFCLVFMGHPDGSYQSVSLALFWQCGPSLCAARRLFFFSALMMTERGSLFKRFWRGKLRSNARLDYLSRLSPRARKDNTDDVGLLLSDVAEFIF